MCECKDYKKELKRIGLPTFLHTYIDDTCLADCILDYFNERRNKVAADFLHYMMEILKKRYEDEKK